MSQQHRLQNTITARLKSQSVTIDQARITCEFSSRSDFTSSPNTNTNVEHVSKTECKIVSNAKIEVHWLSIQHHDACANPCWNSSILHFQSQKTVHWTVIGLRKCWLQVGIKMGSFGLKFLSVLGQPNKKGSPSAVLNLRKPIIEAPLWKKRV